MSDRHAHSTGPGGQDPGGPGAGAQSGARLDADKLAGVLEPGGALSRRFESYEPREAQIDMLRMVAEAFNAGRVAVAEAGTGVGKSFAYLIPAVRWAETARERVVISTATINLQEQLVKKDIPTVLDVMKSPVKAALMKGRGNYLCPVRLAEAKAEATLFDEHDEGLSGLAAWAAETETGDKSDVPFLPAESLWRRVNSDPDTCPGLRCSRRAECFINRARAEAAKAGIIVVNHHLLFSDLAIRAEGFGFEETAVLPPFTRLVIDEAHTVENAATSFFSRSFSRLSIMKQTGRLHRVRRGRTLGLIGAATAYMPSLAAEAPAEIEKIREQARRLDAAAVALVGRSLSLWLSPALHGEADALAPIAPELTELSTRIRSFVSVVNRELKKLDDEKRDEQVPYEIRMAVRRLDAIAEMCREFVVYPEIPDEVFWLDASSPASADSVARFNVTPLTIGEVLRDAVYAPLASVVMTSATLTVQDSFKRWAARVGLAPSLVPPPAAPPDDDDDPNATSGIEPVFGIFPSPFPYEENVLIAVPTDAPPPDGPEYAEWLPPFVAEVLTVSEGRGLVLFTSYDMLDRTYATVRPALAAHGITVFRQGEHDRARLLRMFADETSSVLFATDSFWEGVDTPGESLSVVIVCRLPFRVPSDPVHRARSEAVTEAGGNSFYEFSLPDAVMKLKQGFGRLMRRSSDRGIVIITDVRIATKSYGKAFLGSLPPTQRSLKSSAGVLEDVERFLYS